MTWLDVLKSSLTAARVSRRIRIAALSQIDALESRLLLTAPTLTDSEQYMLELVNRARANPGAEIDRVNVGQTKIIQLNDDLAPGTISNTAKQPLAPQQSLITAAGLHAQDMLDRNYFSHTTQGAKTTFDQRITNQGYNWNRVTENIGYSARSYSVSQTQFINEVHEGLIRSGGHRENIMDPDVNEVGIGARFGAFTDTDKGVTYDFAEMVTEDFGRRNLNPYITGVVYTDSNNDDFYTIGESIRSGTVTAVNVSSGTTFSDTIGVSGAYGLVVPAGSYNVTARFTLNGSARVFQNQSTVVVSTSNVKVDFDTTALTAVPVTLSVTSTVNSLNESGATASTTITVTRDGDTGTTVNVNLTSSDTTEMTVPASVSFPAGQTQVTFTATAVDDGIIDGTQISTITAAVTGYTSGNVALSVVDRTYPVLPVGIQTVATSRPTITWTSISNAATYEVWVNNVTDNVTKVVNTTGIATNSYTTTVDLPIGTFYVWVRGFTSSGLAGPWSSVGVWKLRPTTTVLNSGRTENSGSFNIDWNPIPGASTYDVWVDRLTSGTSQYRRNTSVNGASLPVSNFGIGRYAVWIRGTSSQGDLVGWGSPGIINVNFAPTGLSVTAANLASTPTFAWSSVAGAAVYDVWIDNLTTATTAVIRNISVSGTSLVLNSIPTASYRAWVRARDLNGTNYTWSDSFDFEVQRAPRVTSPFGNGQPARPQFVWTPVSGASRYEIWLANLTTNTIVVNDPNLTSTSYTRSIDLTAGNYRVWIRAFDSTNTVTAWSSPVTFTVAANAAMIPGLENQLSPNAPALDLVFASASQWLDEEDRAPQQDSNPAAVCSRAGHSLAVARQRQNSLMTSPAAIVLRDW